MAVMEFLYASYVLVAGLVLGSFLGLAVVRVPEGQSIIRPPSHCLQCHRRLPWYENIPVLSYLWLRGRCRGCGGRIKPIYFLVELSTALLSLLAYWRIEPWERFLLFECTLILPLIFLFYVDLTALILPDGVTLPGILLGFSARLVDKKVFYPLSSHLSYWQPLLESLMGALAGFLTLLILALVYQKLRGREGLGIGDAKLAAMLGAFFGWQAIFFIFLLASLMGIFYGVVGILLKKFSGKTPLPFGSFLSAAALLYFFLGSRLLFTYLEFFRKINIF